LASLGELPEYDLVNLRIELADVGGSRASMALFANNLLDDYYTPFATNAIATIGTQAVAIGAPRMWGVELKVPFGN
jgi:iron complex outermembrane receptor protein